MRNSRCHAEREIRIRTSKPNLRKCSVPQKSQPYIAVAALLCCALPNWAHTPPQLPDGNGKETVQKACASCHALTTVTNAGHNRAEWTSVVNMMVNQGAPVPKDQVMMLVNYLVKNFPEKPAPDAVVIPGGVEVSIKEWQVPTPGSRPHDPAIAPDGSVWYTGQMANVLGRFDPATQKFKEFT